LKSHAPSPASRKRILLVDDDPEVRNALVSALEQAGYQVAEASNGNEALDLFPAGPFDLVLLDILMPEKDGVETIFALKRMDVGIPIIAMTAGGQIPPHDYLGVAQRLGVFAVLLKPFSQDELLAIVEAALTHGSNGTARPS
jgi:CheY-like chemotaxis protein